MLTSHVIPHLYLSFVYHKHRFYGEKVNSAFVSTKYGVRTRPFDRQSSWWRYRCWSFARPRTPTRWRTGSRGLPETTQCGVIKQKRRSLTNLETVAARVVAALVRPGEVDGGGRLRHVGRLAARRQAAALALQQPLLHLALLLAAAPALQRPELALRQRVVGWEEHAARICRNLRYFALQEHSSMKRLRAN